MAKPKFAVIGAGCGGQTYAGHLASEGYDVSMYNRSQERINGLENTKTISLDGKLTQEGRITLATTNLEQAVEGRDVLVVVTPATGHNEISKNVTPYLHDGQVIVLSPGRTFGGLEFSNNIAQQRPDLDVTVCETNTLPYATRVTEPGKAKVFGVKNTVALAALPNHRTGEVVETLNEFYPAFAPAESFLETGVGNIGAVFHPTILLLNYDKIQKGEPFEFYTEGASRKVVEHMEGVDNERQEIARKLGVKIPTLSEWLVDRYGLKQKGLYEMLKNNPVYAGIMAPTTTDHRYIHEDVSTGLVPLSLTAEAMGIQTPYMDSLINTANSINQTDYWKKGRTLEKMGLDKNHVVEQLKEIVSKRDCRRAA